jgi:hypothetical protein
MCAENNGLTPHSSSNNFVCTYKIKGSGFIISDLNHNKMLNPGEKGEDFLKGFTER